jgi:hypothetical protein
MKRRSIRLAGGAFTAIAFTMASTVGSGCSSRGGNAPPEPSWGPELEYRQSTHLVGLDENVVIVKNPEHVYVIRASGEHQPLARVRPLDDAARRARFGALDPGFSRNITDSAAGTLFSIVIYFDPSVSWDDIRERLLSSDPDVQMAADEALMLGIAAAGSALRPTLQDIGVHILSAADRIPSLHGVASREALLAAAHVPELTLIMPEVQGEPHRDNTLAPDTVWYHAIDTTFNQHNPAYFADNQRIGIVEPMSPTCKIFDTHEAFAENTTAVTYDSTSAPTNCGSDSDCLPVCNVSPADAWCGPSGTCIDGHASQVGSTISAGKDSNTPWGSAKASLYVTNNDALCSTTTAAENAYSWLLSKGVRVANESYDCGQSNYTTDGITQDYYQHMYPVVVTKSAGNMKTTAADTACPYTLNSICVGAVNHAGKMSCFSDYVNPPLNQAGGQSDREEPDLVALGGDFTPSIMSPPCNVVADNVQLINKGTTTDWTGGNAGTSFSAPAVASMVALFRQECGPTNGYINVNSYIRAITRNAAWASNPDHWLYETPAKGHDGKDGGGFLSADKLMLYCGTANCTSDCSGRNPTPTNPTAGPTGDPPPNGGPPNDDGGLSGMAAGVHIENTSRTPGPSDGRGYWTIWTSSGTIHGVRATLSWDVCPSSMTGTAPAAPVTDWDLFLYDQTTHKYLYSSQSNNDNNEGFDYPFGTSGTSDTIVLYAASIPSAGCSGHGVDGYSYALHYY